MNRRHFIGTSAALGGGIALQSLEPFIMQESAATVNVKVLATNWGFHGSLDEYLQKVKKDGYDGIEIWWPRERKGQDELFGLLAKYSLEVGFLCGSYERDYARHLADFREQVQAAATNKVRKPLYVNCHSGRDHFSFDQNKSFIDFTVDLARSSGVKVLHETHRSRILFAAHVTRQYLERIPGLRMTFDVSHWCNVHESLLQDQEETVQMALQRVDHIHARIGHPEGPQVNDPRAPEWKEAVDRHFAWWDQVMELKSKNGGGTLTFLTEFGPADYMPALPYTRQALADQWAINVHMKDLLRKRYS